MHSHRSHLSTCYTYVVLTIALFLYAVPALAATNVELIIQGCNNNNICEINIGEDVNNCSNDCFPTPTPTPTPTTTPIVTPTQSPSGSSSGAGTGYVYPKISDVVVTPDLRSATISWHTSRVSVGTITWGTTLQYEKGMISETLYAFNHSMKIENLSPHTTYYFKLSAQDTLKHTDEITDQSFQTLTPPDIEGPANVSGLSVEQKNDTVQLSWQNPTTPDFYSLRVVRSVYSFPTDPFEGKTIYEGRGNYVTDISIAPNTTYYYTVFTKDFNNNYSSGSVAAITIKTITPAIPNNNIASTTLTPTPSPSVSEPSFNFPLSEVAYTIDPSKLIITQNEEKIAEETGSFTVDPTKETKISIPAPLIKTPVKNVAIILTNPRQNNTQTTFLLTLNKNKTAYETTIDSFGQSGTYNFTLKVINNQQKVDATTSGSFVAPFTSTTTHSIQNPLQNSISITLKTLLNLVILLILILLLLLLKKRG